LPKPIYNTSLTITNSTRSPGEGGIKHELAPDLSKIHTNWYKEWGQQISSPNELRHTLDLSKMWSGVDGAVNQSPVVLSNPPPQISTANYIPSGGPQSFLAKNYSSPATNSKAPVRSDGNDTIDVKLKELQPVFSKTIEEILVSLSQAGFPSRIVEAYRSYATQAQKIAAGYAPVPKPGRKVSAGKHGAGLAADICCRKYGYETSERNAKFYKLLGALAQERGLIWGGTFHTKNGKAASYGPEKWNLGWDPGHLESRSSGDIAKRYMPAGKSEDKISKLTGQSLLKDITSTVSSPLLESIKEFEIDLLSGQGQSLLRAYPTFKLYFIEDDSDMRKRLAFDDFFHERMFRSQNNICCAKNGINSCCKNRKL